MAKQLIVLSLLVATSVVAQDEPYSPFSGDYKVNEIRGMWFTCHNSIRTRSPKSYPYGWKVCDCFVDRMRRTISFEEWNELNQDEQYQLTFELFTSCFKEVTQDVIEPI